MRDASNMEWKPDKDDGRSWKVCQLGIDSIRFDYLV